MKEQRRRLPKAVSPLEMLDDRIVPSAIGPTPVRLAALVEHPSIRARPHHPLRQNARIQAAPRGSSVAPLARPSPVASGGGLGAAIPAPTPTPTPSPTVAATPTVIPDTTAVKSGPLAKAGQELITISQEYQQQGGSPSFTSSLAGLVEIRGTSVGIDAHMASGNNFGNYVSSLAKLGMQIRFQDPTTGTVEGVIPIAQLQAAAQDSMTLALSPIYTSRR